ncbi:ABC transporter permease [Slackia exigua]|uniref:ABC transporter permease n=1 Tax=Slackia exigua TaxID=84109 RepID=UPI00210BEE2C|nr:ABC transporter permease [Slackia exigua]
MKRLIYLLLVIVGITVISFILANVAPVDPAEAYAKRINLAASQEVVESTREEFGFDRPIAEQYVDWASRIALLDFGNSYATKRPVIDEIASVLPNTLSLSLIAACFVALISVPLAILSARREGGLADRVVSGFSFVSAAVPGYLVGLVVLLVFGMRLRMFPIIGHGHPLSMAFAGLALALPMVGPLIRVMRSLILENRDKEFVFYAQARGLSENEILRRHLLLNAAPSCVTMFAQNLGYLVAGTVIVESIFSISGLGQYALKASLNQDFPALNGCLVIMAAFFVVFNLGAELIGARINPRMERDERA